MQYASELNPLQQGLKLVLRNKKKNGLEASELNPLQQGLKLMSDFSSIYAAKDASELNPLQQGLKLQKSAGSSPRIILLPS